MALATSQPYDRKLNDDEIKQLATVSEREISKEISLIHARAAPKQSSLNVP